MTDMRATERLLEVIEERATELDSALFDAPSPGEILEAVIELRRRGDTLVRARDLELVLANYGRIWDPTDEPANAAVERLQNALGGRMR